MLTALAQRCSMEGLDVFSGSLSACDRTESVFNVPRAYKNYYRVGIE